MKFFIAPVILKGGEKEATRNNKKLFKPLNQNVYEKENDWEIRTDI